MHSACRVPLAQQTASDPHQCSAMFGAMNDSLQVEARTTITAQFTYCTRSAGTVDRSTPHTPHPYLANQAPNQRAWHRGERCVTHVSCITLRRTYGSAQSLAVPVHHPPTKLHRPKHISSRGAPFPDVQHAVYVQPPSRRQNRKAAWLARLRMHNHHHHHDQQTAMPAGKPQFR